MLNNLVMPVDNEIVPAALHMTTLPPLQWAIYFNCVHKFEKLGKKMSPTIILLFLEKLYYCNICCNCVLKQCLIQNLI